MGLIYRHVSPSGKSYVGQTTLQSWEARVGSNPLLAYENSPKFLYAIAKYGWEQFDHEILESDISEIDQLNDRERYWIQELDCITNGYNLHPGGGRRKASFDNSKKQIDFRADELKRYYLLEKRSLREVAKIYGCSYILVREALLKFGIPLHGNGFLNTARREKMRSLAEEKQRSRLCVVCSTAFVNNDSRVTTCYNRSCRSKLGSMRSIQNGTHYWAKQRNIIPL